MNISWNAADFLVYYKMLNIIIKDEKKKKEVLILRF